ncbi:MAG: histidine--tRNA ligase [Actinobacteria bacterium]|nr:MAG: histidine--tRNA ligase [Actinomycetota bacterium]
MCSVIVAPKGTSDMLPGLARKWQHLLGVAARLFESYGYEPIDTPAFEATELFVRGIGEATDIVHKEMYTFTDKGGRSLTLRPEETAPVVRAYLQHNMGAAGQLVKLYYAGPMFRFERPQAGRSRQFWQIGIEALGSEEPSVDAESILLLMRYLQRLGLQQLTLLVNSMGCIECRPAYRETLAAYLREHAAELCKDCVRRLEMNPLRVFDCKNPECVAVMKNAPKISEYLCQGCEDHFGEVKTLLGEVGLDYEERATLVRGFDYYTKTTFEVQSPLLGAQNALGGGGRYDGLAEMIGGARTPGIGFALGAERTMLAMEGEQVAVPSKMQVHVYVANVDAGTKQTAFGLLSNLREQGISAETDYMGRSLKGQMKQAGKRGVLFTVILGPEELARGECKVRNMESGEETPVALDSLALWLSQKIRQETI